MATVITVAADEFSMYEGLRATRDADSCLRGLNAFRRGLRGAGGPAFLARYLRASPEWQELQAVWDAQLTIQHYHVTVTLLLALTDALKLATAAATAAPEQQPEAEAQRAVLAAGGASLASAVLHRRLKALYFALSSDVRGKANAALALLAAVAGACTGGGGAPPLHNLVRAFDWSLSALPALSRPPREKKGEAPSEHRQRYWQQWELGDALKRPTRALFSELALGLLRQAGAPATGDPLLLQQLLQLRPLVGGLLCHLGGDPPAQQLQVLQLLQKRVLSARAAVPPAVQAEAFSDAALQQLAAIAATAAVEGAEEEGEEGEAGGGEDGAAATVAGASKAHAAAAAAALEVLLAVATAPCHGVAAASAATAQFALADAGSHQLQPGQRRLLRLLLRLRPADSAAHLQLLLAAAAADAPLAAALLLALPYTLEPAATGAGAGAAAVGRWFAHTAVASRLLQQLPEAAPVGLQLLAGGGSSGTPPPAPGGRQAQALLRCCFPPCLQKAALSRGLQHGNALVRYGTLGLLVSAMSALEAVLLDCTVAADAAGSAQQQGWLALRRWLQQAARQQLPDPTLLVALLAAAEKKEGWGEANELQLTAVLRLLLLWQRLLPGALAEANVDAERLLPQQPLALRPEHQLLLLEMLHAAADASAAAASECGAPAAEVAMTAAATASLLPALRLLGGSSAAAVRGAARRWLLRRLLATGAFGGNEEEAVLWLDLLPSGGEAVCAFWAEALQLLLRRPHELFELQQQLLGEVAAGSGGPDSTALQQQQQQPPVQFSLLVPCALRQLLRVLPSAKIPGADKAAAAAYVAAVLRQLAQQQLGGSYGETSAAAAQLAAVLLGVVRLEAARQQEQQQQKDGAVACQSSKKEKKRKSGNDTTTAATAAAVGPLLLPAEARPLLELLADLEQQQPVESEEQPRKKKKQSRESAAAAAAATCQVAALAQPDGGATAAKVAPADACCLLVSQLAAGCDSDSSVALLAQVQRRLAADAAGSIGGTGGVSTCSAALRQCLHLLQRSPGAAASAALLQVLRAALFGGGVQEQARCLQLLAGSSLIGAAQAASGGSEEVQQAVGMTAAQLLHQLLNASHGSSSSSAAEVACAPLLQQVAAAFQQLVAAAAGSGAGGTPAAVHTFLLLLPHMPGAAVEVTADLFISGGNSGGDGGSSSKKKKKEGTPHSAAPAAGEPWRAAAAAAVLKQLVARGLLQQPQRLEQACSLLLQLAAAPASSDGWSSAAVYGCLLQMLGGPQRWATLGALGSSGRQQLLRCCLAPGARSSSSQAACSRAAALLVESCDECRLLAAELLLPLLEGVGTSGLPLALPAAVALLEQQQPAEQLPEGLLGALQQALLVYFNVSSSSGAAEPAKKKKIKGSAEAAEAAAEDVSASAAQLLQQHALPCLLLLLKRQPLSGKQRKGLLTALLPKHGWPVGVPGGSSNSSVQPGVMQQAEAAAALLAAGASVEELAACVRCFATTLATLLKLPAQGELERQLLDLLDGPVGDAVAGLSSAQRGTAAFAEVAVAAAGTLGTTVLRHRLAASTAAGEEVARAAGVVAMRVLRRFMAALLPDEDAEEEEKEGVSSSDDDDGSSSDEDVAMPDRPQQPLRQQQTSNPTVSAAALQLLQRLLGHSCFLPAMRVAAASPPPLPPAAQAQPRPLASLLPLAAAADDATLAATPAATSAAEMKKELCELLETLLDMHQQYSSTAASWEDAQQVAAAEAALLPLLMAGYGASCSPTDCAVWSLAAAINQRQWRRQLAEQPGREGAAAAALAATEGDADVEALSALLHGPLSQTWFAWGPGAAALQQLRPGGGGGGDDEHQRRRQLLQQRLPLDPLRAALTACHWPEACVLAAAGSSSASAISGSSAASSHLAQLPGSAAAYDPGFILPFAICCLRQQLLSPRAFAEAGLLSVCLRGLAAADAGCRAAAYQAVALFEAQLPAPAAAHGFREAQQLSVLLGALRAAVNRPFQRLPAVHAVFLAEAALLALHPGAPMYPAANKHLARRAVLSTADVPLLGQLLLAGGQQHAIERRWMAQLLLAGLRSGDDAAVYRSRHALELAMSLYDSSVADPAVSSLALRLVGTATYVPHAARQLTQESGLIPWLAAATEAALLQEAQHQHQPVWRGGSDSPAAAAEEALGALRRLLQLRAVMRGAGGAAAAQQMVAAACQLAAATRSAVAGRRRGAGAAADVLQRVLPFLLEVQQQVGGSGGGQAPRGRPGSDGRGLVELATSTVELQALL